MDVIIDGVRYLPANVAQPDMEELNEFIQKLRGKSRAVATNNVPAEWSPDDDRGRPFDKAYEKRVCFDSGYCTALTEIQYWIERKQKNVSKD